MSPMRAGVADRHALFIDADQTIRGLASIVFGAFSSRPATSADFPLSTISLHRVMSFSIHSIYGQIFKIWRQKRFALFLRIIRPRISDTLLDVGGYPSFWTSHPQSVKRIDTVNVHEVHWDNGRAPNHSLRTLVGDGCHLAFLDKSYDIGFSNSVIEHVGLWERQQEFAAEIRRVARNLWIQTPAYRVSYRATLPDPVYPLPPQNGPEDDYAVVHVVGMDSPAEPYPNRVSGRDNPAPAKVRDATTLSRLRDPR